jgi:hypothetical protein
VVGPLGDPDEIVIALKRISGEDFSAIAADPAVGFFDGGSKVLYFFCTLRSIPKKP